MAETIFRKPDTIPEVSQKVISGSMPPCRMGGIFKAYITYLCPGSTGNSTFSSSRIGLQFNSMMLGMYKYSTIRFDVYE